ncbi:MAG: PKD domain-containing protein [Sphingobacteriales bacterium JAD_PAG50586_3]|nr:MAG: PKD domain-containing protein [Sphingobacteriales bacterium JAD_PAG50586_3]
MGGANGTSSSPAVIEFPPQGATRGFSGVTTNTLTGFDLSALDATACAGQTVNLQVNVTGTLPQGYTIQWIDTANGGSVVGTGASLQFTANPPQTLFATTCPGTFSVPVQIIGGDEPLAGFTFTDAGGYEAVFTNTSTNAASYLWSFGDGSTSTDAAPSHQYNSDGTYTVTLIATNACGNDTITQQVYVAKTGLNDNYAQAVKIIPGADYSTYYVDLGSNACLDVDVMINDISGRMLQQGKLYYGGNGFAGPVDLSGYSAGMYLLSLHCNNKTYYAKLIVR